MWQEKSVVLAVKIKACTRDKYKRYYKVKTALKGLIYINMEENKKLKETLQLV